MAGSITLAELLSEVHDTDITTANLIASLKHNMEKPRYGWQVVLHQSTAARILKALERLEKIEKLVLEAHQ